MANTRFDARQLRQFRNKLLYLTSQQEEDEFIRSCIKELAARLLAKTIKRTPVGQYPQGSGKMGGTLRRGWTANSHEEAENGKGQGKNASTWVNSLNISKQGNNYTIVITNPVEYASYVEYGHRTANQKGWVEGQFMLTISENEIQAAAPQILEAKLMNYLLSRLK